MSLALADLPSPMLEHIASMLLPEDVVLFSAVCAGIRRALRKMTASAVSELRRHVSVLQGIRLKESVGILRLTRRVDCESRWGEGAPVRKELDDICQALRLLRNLDALYLERAARANSTA